MLPATKPKAARSSFQGNQRSGTHLLHIPVQAEDIEDPVAVHLGLVQAVDHQHGAVGMGAEFRGWRRWRGVTILGAIPAWSPVAATHRWAHPPPFVVWWWRAIAFIVVVPVIATMRSSWRRNKKR